MMSNNKSVEIASAVVQQDLMPESTATQTSDSMEMVGFTETSMGSGESFRLLFENSLDAIVIADDDGRYLDVNASACELFGYSREQMLLLRVNDLMTADLPGAGERYERYLQTGREAGEFTFVRQDNEVRIASYSACRLAPGRHISTLRDITSQRREQEESTAALARQSRLFDTTLSSIVDFAYVFDREGRFTYVNQALLSLWQRELKEALGKNFFELDYPPELAARLQEQIQSVFDTGQPLRGETPYTGAAGNPGYYEYIFVPVFGTDGEVEVVAGSTRDITVRQQEKREKEALLQALEVERARLADVIGQAPAFIAVMRGPEHTFELVNAPYNRLVGNRELIGRRVRDAFPEIEGQGFFEFLDDVYRTGKPFFGKAMRILFQEEASAPLREHFIDFVYQPLIEADGSVSGIFAHGVDLTERIRAEEALRERQSEIETLNHRLRHSMRETHHRVKNNLQVIAAMIEMQVMEHQEEQIVPLTEFVRLKAHVHTLAIVHDLLTFNLKAEEYAQRIPTKAVLEKLLPMLQLTAWKQTVRYSVEDVELTSKQCIALALVLNELVSNALKHGKQEVEVFFSVEGQDATLAVCDDGSGFLEGFDPKKAANTGLELVGSLVRIDLRGTIVYGNRPEGGGLVTVVFPLPQDES